jgi:hypothetical protein
LNEIERKSNKNNKNKHKETSVKIVHGNYFSSVNVIEFFFKNFSFSTFNPLFLTFQVSGRQKKADFLKKKKVFSINACPSVTLLQSLKELGLADQY